MTGPMNSKKWLAASVLLGLLLIAAFLLRHRSAGAQDAPPPADISRYLTLHDAGPVNAQQIADAAEGLFDDDAAGTTQAFILMRDGKIIAERYGDGIRPETKLLSRSIGKTVTAALIGLMVSDGRLALDSPAPVPAWSQPGDPRGEITLRQLLQMRSGLRHSEADATHWRSDNVRMLFLDGRDDMAGYAEAQPLEAEPGRTFEYSSASTVILADLAARSLTESRDPAFRRAAIADYLRTRLFEPVGMRSAVAEFDAAGTFIGSGMVHATARDWGRFGEFLRNGGSVKGGQVVPRGWIDFMTTPSPRNAGFGAQLWLNRPQPDGREVLFPGMAPADAFACIGQLGQYVVVSPGQKLTVVRLGRTDDAGLPALRRHLAGIAALFPGR